MSVKSYTKSKHNNVMKTEYEDYGTIETSKMHRKSFKTGENIYYTKIEGLGNPIYLVGIMKKGEPLEAIVTDDTNPEKFNDYETYEDNVINTTGQSMDIKTFDVLFNELNETSDTTSNNKEILERLKANKPHNFKNRRLYILGNDFFDGKTHKFLYDSRAVNPNDAVKVINDFFFTQYTTGDQAKKDINTLMAAMTATKGTPMLPSHIFKFGGVRKMKKTKNKRKSKNKTIKRSK